MYYPAPERLFTEEEIAEVLARYDGRDDLLGVIRHLLHRRLAEAVAASADEVASDAVVRHAGGRMQELTSFAEELSRRFEQAKANKHKK